VHFVREFVKGRVPRSVYKLMIKDLFFVYSALEEEFEKHKEHEILSQVHFPRELNRTANLVKDMEYYFGHDWRRHAQPSPAAEAYVLRIRELGSGSEPLLLIAHAYTRYMGDLSGGRVLMKIAVKTMGLDAAKGDGIRFYQFDDVPNPREFKKMYRSKLDALGIAKDASSELVDEANAAFFMNMDLFKELDCVLGLENVPIEESDPSKCPFANLTARSTMGSGDHSMVSTSNCPMQLSFYTGRPVLLAMMVCMIAVAASILMLWEI